MASKRTPVGIPRRIWMYWDSRGAATPELVDTCIESWKQLNLNYVVEVITPDTVINYLDPSDVTRGRHRLSPQKMANLIRLELLARYGGIWADATLFCVRPLDSWLPALDDGCFITCDNSAHPTRPIANFFIAARPGNAFLVRWLFLLKRYFRSFPERMDRERERELRSRLKWLSPWLKAVVMSTTFVRDSWGHPYFIAQYLAFRAYMGPMGLFRRYRVRTVTFGRGLDQAKGPAFTTDFTLSLRHQSLPAWKLESKRGKFNHLLPAMKAHVRAHGLATDNA